MAKFVYVDASNIFIERQPPISSLARNTPRRC